MKTLYVLVTLLDQGKCGTGFATELDEPAQYLALFARSLAWLFTLVKIHKGVDHAAFQRGLPLQVVWCLEEQLSLLIMTHRN